jgi:hypothetical protein
MTFSISQPTTMVAVEQSLTENNVKFASGTLTNNGDSKYINLRLIDDFSGGLIYINTENYNKVGNSSVGLYTRDVFITLLETTNNAVAQIQLSDDGDLNITSITDVPINYSVKIIKIMSNI